MNPCMPEHPLVLRLSTLSSKLSTRNSGSALGPASAGREEHAAARARVVGLSDRANHGQAGRPLPGAAHALACVAAPALAVGIPREGTAVDAGQIFFVQPGSGGAVDHSAVVEHEAVLVAVPEVFEIADGQPGAGLAMIEI